MARFLMDITFWGAVLIRARHLSDGGAHLRSGTY